MVMKTKVHRRDLKVIDSDAKVAEIYKNLRQDVKKDAQHCMPVKKIPDLEWDKKQSKPNSTEKRSNSPEERKLDPP